jgi:hypothetical protein
MTIDNTLIIIALVSFEALKCYSALKGEGLRAWGVALYIFGASSTSCGFQYELGRKLIEMDRVSKRWHWLPHTGYL